MSDSNTTEQFYRAEIEARIAILDRAIADTDRYLSKLRQERIDLKLILTDVPL